MRKKHLITIGILFLVLLISACKAKDSTKRTEEGQIIESIEETPVVEEFVEPEPSIIENPCNNVLFPLEMGNQWMYEIQTMGEDGQPNKSDFAWTVASVINSHAELGTLFYDSGLVLKSTVECADEVILNFPLTEINLVFGEVVGKMDYEYISGVYMPSLADFEAGGWKNTWETELTVSGVINAMYDNESATIELSESPVTLSWQVIEKDTSVEVPAGLFDNAVLISQEMKHGISSLKTTIEGRDFDIATTITLKSKLWFSPYVGLLKQEVESASILFYQMDFPLESIGRTELKSSNLLE